MIGAYTWTLWLWCSKGPTDKPTSKRISAPLVATTFYRDNECNNQIEIDNLRGKWALDNTRRGGDGQREASGAMDNMTRGGGGGQRKTSGWRMT
jgi:hypothetical protein